MSPAIRLTAALLLAGPLASALPAARARAASLPFTVSYADATDLSAGQRQAATTYLTTVYGKLTGAIPQLQSPRLSIVKWEPSDKVAGLCGLSPSSIPAGSILRGCYNVQSRTVYFNDAITANMDGYAEGMTHELLHSFSVPQSSTAYAPWEEMWTEHFAQQVYPTANPAYAQYQPVIDGLIPVLAAAKVSDPGAFLASMQYQYGVASLNALLDPYVSGGKSFTDQLVGYMSSDPAHNDMAGARAFLSQVQTNVTLSPPATTTTGGGTGSSGNGGSASGSGSGTSGGNGGTGGSGGASGTDGGTVTDTPLGSTFSDTSIIAPAIPSDNSVNRSLGSLSGFFQSIYGKVFNLLAALAALLAVIMIVYNGIRYVTAGGDAAKVKAARANIVSIMIGVIIIVSAYLIIRLALTLGAAVSNQA